MSRINALTGTKFSTLAIALFGVMGLGAKGCDRAVVGDDGQCKAEDCSPSDGGADSGTGGTGTAGTSSSAGRGGKPGTGGESSAGRGGSGTAGKGDGGGGASGSIICGGLVGLPCPKEQYCSYAPEAHCGAADQTGLCAPIPDACPANYDPVCGCDDVTYGNSCGAAAMGVSVASEGACESDGVVCGGFAGEQCAEGEYCDYPADSYCGRADGPGVCKAVPDACDTVYDPVCGCDGQTYGNSCEAALHGVSVETEGECETDPHEDACGGLQGLQCEEGMFCNYSLEALCGAADQMGVCEEIPAGCTKDYRPVCGCDGVTYDNECVANSHGISAASEGTCEPEVDFCGGIAGFGCPDGQYCAFPLESMCGDGDMTGKCADKPEGCTTNYDPVCGCDGMTYGNSCEAASAGISVRSDGECPRAE